MKKKPTTIFIPGFGITKPTQNMGKVFIPTWKNRTLKHWVKEFEDFIQKNRIKDFTAIGFSMGALIIACSNVKPKKTILIAMTPLFKEDKDKWTPEWIRSIGIRRFKDLGVFVPKKNITFFVGGRDTSVINKCVERISRKNKSKVVVVPEAGHDIADFMTVI